MIFRNLLIGWRNIRKNGIFSVINIVGLSLGIAVVTLILFWVVDELSYDKFNTKIDQIYTVYEYQQFSEGQELYTYSTPFPLGKALVNNFSEVENATTIANIGNQLIKVGDKEIKEGPVVCTDSEFLTVFSFEILQGDKNALQSPDKIIINEEVAAMLFGNEPAIGKMVKINDNQTYSVGAVVKTDGLNSTIDFKILKARAELDAYEMANTVKGKTRVKGGVISKKNIQEETNVPIANVKQFAGIKTF